MLRTHTCGQLTSRELGQTVILAGWVDTVRKLGGMTFVDLRDRHGMTQINFDPSQTNADLVERVAKLRLESVVQITGVVIARPAGMTNAEMVTGEIEIQPTELVVLSEAGELPFSINHENAVSEELRLEHRYLDLRRASNREMLRLRHRLTIDIMNFFDREGFTYIETPTFVKNTPEWAKEYIVPTSSHPGKFFVLPQSPQQLKQLSMVAGVDRYYQLARCYRDEPLRWDRQPEFTQLDLEMSFVEQEDVLELLERHFKQIWRNEEGKRSEESKKNLSDTELLDLLPSRKEYQDLSEQNDQNVWWWWNGQQHITYIGDTHQNDTAHPEFQQIVSDFRVRDNYTSWLKRVIIWESIVWWDITTREESYINASTPGLLTALAKESNSEYICPEPLREDECVHLEKYFNPEQILCAYVIRTHEQYLRMQKTNPDMSKRFQHKRIKNIATRYWLQHILEEKDLSSFVKEVLSYEINIDDRNHLRDHINPYLSNSILNEISYRLNDLRDIRILKSIQHYRNEGYSIFIWYGLGHLIAHKKALEKICHTWINKKIWWDIKKQKTLIYSPFLRMTRDECMNIYGIDKPELRTQAMKLIDLTIRGKASDFGLFQSAEVIKAICVPKVYSRSEIDKTIIPLAQQKGAKGVAWLSYSLTDGWKGSILKFFDEKKLDELKTILTFTPTFYPEGTTSFWEGGFTLFFQTDTRQHSVEVLWFLRNYFIKDLNLLAGKENELAFAFVTDFPLYEVDPETGDFASAHHPFTKPKLQDIPFVIWLGQKVLEGWHLSREDKQGLADLRADCYDLVLNGYELGSGSIRITDPVLQTSIFAILGLTQEQITDRFWHMLKAFSFWVPPHGGFAYGLDRVVMIYAGKPNIREVIPYPKNNQGVDLMLRAPGEVDEKILEGVGIVVKK